MSDKINVHNKTFQIYLEEEKITARVEALAEAINQRNQDNCPVFLVILKGAFLFATELIKRFNGPCEVEFIKVSSYKGTESSGEVRVENLDHELLTGRDVIIIEDIVDSGRTMHNFLPIVKASNPRSVQLCTLLFKPEALKYPVDIDYKAFEIPNEFVVGFGLDYDGIGRNFPCIYQLSE